MHGIDVFSQLSSVVQRFSSDQRTVRFIKKNEKKYYRVSPFLKNELSVGQIWMKIINGKYLA